MSKRAEQRAVALEGRCVARVPNGIRGEFAIISAVNLGS